MKILKFSISLIITLALIYSLNRSWVVGGNRLPPLGKFLDPFHGFWQNMESDDYAFPRELDIPGLKDKVTVVFDSLAIPHIFANNDEDLYLAQGYITAKHRLWHMEFMIYAAAGRVSEIIGEGKNGAVLNFDRGQRRLGLEYGAKNGLKRIESDSLTKMMISKYTEGVNRYIESLTYQNFPFEYKLLDYSPESWTSLKCALLLENMSQTLSMGDKDIQMTNTLALFGKDVVDLLYPDREEVGDPVVDNPDGWKFKPIKIDSAPLALPNELIAINKIPGSEPGIGSNNWAVHGSKTVTGSPILCGDPHLNLNLPSIWYAIQLNAPGINVMGASLPGAPSVVIGFNDSIAWSLTNAERDLIDWFKISFQDSKREKYLLDGKWIDSKKVVEPFMVRDKPVFHDTVVYTNWGPVTYDENYHADTNLKGYAFRWNAHDPSQEFLTLYKLNRAKNHRDYMDALDYFFSPAQNVVFASVSGDVAIRVQGQFPVRRKSEGKFVLDGSKSSNGWQAFIPNEQNITHKNPERGFVSSANQYPADATYPYYITADSYEAYRNRRINSVLSNQNPIAIADMMKLQADNYNLKAAESLSLFLSYLDSTSFTVEEQEAYAILKSWDFYNTIESEGASYYAAWLDNLLPLIWDEMRNEKFMLQRPTTFTTIKLIKEKPDLSFFDIQGTPEKEDAKSVVRKAYSLGVDDIQKWKSEHADSGDEVPWADYKDSYIGHLLRLEPLNIHIRHGGEGSAVNAHSRTHGPSWRMIVSLEKSGVKTWATYPGGQSGNPGSKHFSDLLDRWVSDTYYQLLFMHQPGDAAGKIYFTTQLNPSTK